MHKYLEKKGDINFEKIFRQRLGKESTAYPLIIYLLNKYIFRIIRVRKFIILTEFFGLGLLF
jgi:hypothetical protein